MQVIDLSQPLGPATTQWPGQEPTMGGLHGLNVGSRDRVVRVVTNAVGDVE